MSQTSYIDTEVPYADLEELLKFILQSYVLPHQESFANFEITVIDQIHVLTFTVLKPEGMDVEIWALKPIRVKIVPRDETVSQAVLDRIREDIIIMVQNFEEEVRKNTLYFSWVEGEKVVPEKAQPRREKTITGLFTESMLLLYIAFLAASILLFSVLGLWAPLVLVAFQFIIVLFSDRIIMKMGAWNISSENPNVHFLKYHLPVEEHNEFFRKYGRDVLTKIKKEIYDKTLAVGENLNCDIAAEVFAKYGVKYTPEKAYAKTINVYDLVKTAAEKFNVPVPKITISNTMLPNAAASGPSPSRGAILMTRGLLVQLENDEIVSVLGHELSHLKGRDPLVLFLLTMSEYLLRVYILWPIFFSFPSLYLLFALGAVYFFAKFLEARSDFESAVKIGQPQVLAEALRKIGFRKLQFERMPAYRIQGWIGWEPHPPLYFRIERLEKLQSSKKVRYLVLQSAKDCINGFFDALKPQLGEKP